MPPKEQENIIISYAGQLDFETIGVLIGQLQQKMKDLGEKVFIYKKVLSAMIESLENIYKYYTDTDFGAHNGQHVPRFTLSKSSKGYVIDISNPVLIKDKEYLNKKLEKVSSLDKEGLKQLYKDTITDGKFTNKGGAGLGFIEMAKLASEKLKYKFTDINKTVTEYNLIITI